MIIHPNKLSTRKVNQTVNQKLPIQMTKTQLNKKTLVEIQEWLVIYLAKSLEVETTEIDLQVSFDEYSLNSHDAIYLTGELEEWLGLELEATLLYEYTNIKELSEYLVTC